MSKQKDLDRQLIDGIVNLNFLKVKESLDNGANVNVKDDIGWSPLHYVAYLGHEKIAKLILSRNPKIDGKEGSGTTPLIIASSIGNESLVDLLIEKKAKINEQDKMGLTAFISACERGDYSIAKKLYEAGANIELALKNGKTARDRLVEKSQMQSSVNQQLNQILCWLDAIELQSAMKKNKLKV